MYPHCASMRVESSSLSVRTYHISMRKCRLFWRASWNTLSPSRSVRNVKLSHPASYVAAGAMCSFLIALVVVLSVTPSASWCQVKKYVPLCISITPTSVSPSMISSPLRSGRRCAVMHVYVPYATASSVPFQGKCTPSPLSERRAWEHGIGWAHAGSRWKRPL